MSDQDFEVELKKRIDEAERAVSSYLPAEAGYARYLLRACNYSVLNGGKRLRPIFMRSAYGLCLSIGGGVQNHSPDGSDESPGPGSKGNDKGSSLSKEDEDILFPFMAAIEMIHSSSLVHDDLPCMDDDRLRRGKQSTWAKFGEDFGVLAGDGLLLCAFETACKSKADPQSKSSAIEILSSKSGIYGMTGGQSVDVELTGKRPSLDQLKYIYEHKTGSLIEASFMIGAVLSGDGKEIIDSFEKLGNMIGMAFQIQDDILDITGTKESLGKNPHQDEKQDKFTWVSLYGLEKARKDVYDYSREAAEILLNMGGDEFLEGLIRYLTARNY